MGVLVDWEFSAIGGVNGFYCGGFVIGVVFSCGLDLVLFSSFIMNVYLSYYPIFCWFHSLSCLNVSTDCIFYESPLTLHLLSTSSVNIFLASFIILLFRRVFCYTSYCCMNTIEMSLSSTECF